MTKAVKFAAVDRPGERDGDRVRESYTFLTQSYQSASQADLQHFCQAMSTGNDKHNNCSCCKLYNHFLHLIATYPRKRNAPLSKQALRRHIAKEYGSHLSKPSAWTEALP